MITYVPCFLLCIAWWQLWSVFTPECTTVCVVLCLRVCLSAFTAQCVPLSNSITVLGSSVAGNSHLTSSTFSYNFYFYEYGYNFFCSFEAKLDLVTLLACLMSSVFLLNSCHIGEKRKTKDEISHIQSWGILSHLWDEQTVIFQRLCVKNMRSWAEVKYWKEGEPDTVPSSKYTWCCFWSWLFYSLFLVYSICLKRNLACIE